MTSLSKSHYSVKKASKKNKAKGIATISLSTWSILGSGLYKAFAI